MSTTTQTRKSSTTAQARKTTASAKKTGASAKKTGTDAKTTVRSAAGTARTATRKATTTARRETQAAERGLVVQGRRVLNAAQAEVSAVANQPTRPLFFALGVADRTVAGFRAAPGTVGTAVLEAPRRTRERLVDVVAGVGDLAERSQQQYTEVTKDGQKLVRAIRRQDSTQAAVNYAERAGKRAQSAVKDAEKAVESGVEAAGEAVNKLG